MGKSLWVLIYLCLTLSLLLAACGPANGTVGPAASNPGTASAAPATNSPAGASQAPAVQATDFPPIVLPDAGAIRDIHNMDSYTMTAQFRESGTNLNADYGALGPIHITTQQTIEYIKDPEKYHVSEAGRFEYTNGTNDALDRDLHLIGDQLFEKQSGGGFVSWWLWIPSIPRNQLRIKYFAAQSSFLEEFNWLRSAHLAGQEAYNGIPSNHFTFDETDLDPQALQASEIKLDKAQGNFYLALDGNYPVHYDVKMTGEHVTPYDYYDISTYEVVKDLVSINKINEILLPPDVPHFDLDNGTHIPLPPGAVLEHIYLSSGKIFYYYDTDMGSIDEVVAFYKALQPGSGWSFVSYDGNFQYIYITNGNTTLNIHVDMENGRAQVNPTVEQTP